MTGIQWTQDVWNPTTGCDKVSPGCGLPRFDGDLTGGCYAMAMAKRLKGMGQPKYQRDGDPRTSGPGFGLTVHADVLDLPLRWLKPRRIFVNSMSDLFHEKVPDEFIACVFAVMAMTPQHTYQLLTKRHGRMRSLLSSDEFRLMCFAAGASRGWDLDAAPWPLPNLHLGVSAEDQHWADIRVPALLQTPAVVRWVSAEPLLGPISLDRYLWLQGSSTAGPFYDYAGRRRSGGGIGGQAITSVPARDLHWVVAGGESGPGARRCELEWLRSLQEQCAEADVPYFCKQLGSALGRELGAGPKGGDLDAFPEDLRVRQFPLAAEEVPA